MFRRPSRLPSIPLSAVGSAAILIAVGAGAALLAATASNRDKVSLRCEEGRLRPYRGALWVWGEQAMTDPRLPPLTVRPSKCRDRELPSMRALEVRYVEIALEEIDAALTSEQPEALEAAWLGLDTLAALRKDDGWLAPRRQALTLARLRADVATARAARLRAQEHLSRARTEGVDPALLRELEGALFETVAADDPDAEPVEDPAPRPAAGEIPAVAAPVDPDDRAL